MAVPGISCVSERVLSARNKEHTAPSDRDTTNQTPECVPEANPDRSGPLVDAPHLLAGQREIEDIEIPRQVLAAIAFGMATTPSCWTRHRSETCAVVLVADPFQDSVASG